MADADIKTKDKLEAITKLIKQKKQQIDDLNRFFHFLRLDDQP